MIFLIHVNVKFLKENQYKIEIIYTFSIRKTEPIHEVFFAETMYNLSLSNLHAGVLAADPVPHI